VSEGALQQVVEAWGLLLRSAETLKGIQTFHYDLVDVGRQVMSKRATEVWEAVAEAYQYGRSLIVESEGARLLQLLDDLDELLASHRWAWPSWQPAACDSNQSLVAASHSDATAWGHAMPPSHMACICMRAALCISSEWTGGWVCMQGISVGSQARGGEGCRPDGQGAAPV
jgi:hypothetical protein